PPRRSSDLVVDHDHPHVLAEDDTAVLGGNDAHSAFRHRLIDKLVPVKPLAAQRNETGAGLEGPAVGGDAGHEWLGSRLCEASSGPREELVCGDSLHVITGPASRGAVPPDRRSGSAHP